MSIQRYKIHNQSTKRTIAYQPQRIGRPRPHRSPRRPRIPLLQYVSPQNPTHITRPSLPIHRHPILPLLQQTAPLANRLSTSRLRRQPLQQNPPRHKQPLRAHHLLPELQTLPLVPTLLRAILRRRHLRGATPLPRRPLPAIQLPRHPRRQPGSLRALLDRHHRRLHPFSRRNHLPVSGREEERG